MPKCSSVAARSRNCVCSAKRTTSNSSSSITRSRLRSNEISKARSNRRVVDRTEPHSRHLRAARRSHEGKLQVELAQLQVYVDAPHAALDAPRASERRYRHARTGRNAARNRPPADRRAHQGSSKARSTSCASAARHAARARERNAARAASSLVGYTNAGKSTLFNALTKAQAYAADQLFATLDHDFAPARSSAGSGQSSSPTRSGSSANCRTISSPRSAPRSKKPRRRSAAARRRRVERRCGTIRSIRCNEVCASIGADNIRQMLVFNKIDAVPELAAREEAVERDEMVIFRAFS